MKRVYINGTVRVWFSRRHDAEGYPWLAECDGIVWKCQEATVGHEAHAETQYRAEGYPELPDSPKAVVVMSGEVVLENCKETNLDSPGQPPPH